jgi:hypothetical protein
LPGKHNKVKDNRKIHKSVDVENGEFRSAVKVIKNNDPPARTAKISKLPPGIRSILKRQKTSPEKRMITNQYIGNIQNKIKVENMQTSKPPIQKVMQKMQVKRPYNDQYRGLKDEDLDNYDSDFIDDSNLNDLGGNTGYDMRTSSTQNLVSGVVKDLFGTNKYDYVDYNDDDIEEAGFNQIMAEEKRSRMYGKREDERELQRLQKPSKY